MKTLIDAETREYIQSESYRFYKCGAQFGSIEALIMHIKEVHLLEEDTDADSTIN